MGKFTFFGVIGCFTALVIAAGCMDKAAASQEALQVAFEYEGELVDIVRKARAYDAMQAACDGQFEMINGKCVLKAPNV